MSSIAKICSGHFALSAAIKPSDGGQTTRQMTCTSVSVDEEIEAWFFQNANA